MGRRGLDYTVGLDEGLNLYTAAEEDAIAALHKAGLSGPSAPPSARDGSRFTGRVPNDLASLNIVEISEIYNLMEHWANYTSWQRAVADASLVMLKEKKDFAEANIRKTKTGTAQEKRDDTIVDERYVAVNAGYIRARTYAKLVENIEEAARRDLRFISRIIETKKLEQEAGSRGERIERGTSATAPARFRRQAPTGRRRRRRKDDD